MFVVTTPFAVNAFLASHIEVLSDSYRIVLCTNLDAYDLTPSLMNRVEVSHVPFARKISLGADLKSLLKLVALVSRVRPVAIHSITPKAGLLVCLTAGIPSPAKSGPPEKASLAVPSRPLID